MTIEILSTGDFETLRAEAISDVFEPYLIEKVGDQRAREIIRGLESPNETGALLLDCMVLYKQRQDRINNYKAKQHFSETVSDSKMIDLIVSKYNLKRQVIEPADNNVFPPKPAVMESDQSLLVRYALAPYGLATTGTRAGYKFHALTLNERPLISIQTESEDVVVLRYQFLPTVGVERPKDADAKTTQANSGKIEVRLLSFKGNGTAEQSLIDSVTQYLNRFDIAQETDEVTVKSGVVRPYEIEIEVKEVSKPNQLVDKAALDKSLQAYVDEQHRLGGEILRSRIDQIAHNHNAYSVDIKKPVSDFVCDWFEAPYCTEITTSVRAKEL